MAAATQQVNAQTYALDLSALASSLANTLALAQAIQQRQTNHGYLATLAAMPTYSLNSDGTQGTTDGAVNNAHPIVGLNVSYNQLNAMVATLGDFINYATGTAAPAAFDRRPIFGVLLP